MKGCITEMELTLCEENASKCAKSIPPTQQVPTRSTVVLWEFSVG